jgi:SAM-dependent methyltransferase
VGTGAWQAGGVGMTHWDEVYRDRDAEQVSWYQSEPAVSLRLLEAAGLHPGTSVVDVGGGASRLVDRLLARGVQDLSVVDVAEAALRASQQRLAATDELGALAGRVDWLVSDVLEWRPARRYDIWHDRAVFHFLTDPDQRRRYAAVLDQALSPDGHAVIATFAADGPEYCSGLPAARYEPDELAAQFPMLRPVRAEREEHRTPAGVVQPFTWLLLSRKGNAAADLPAAA